MLFRNIGRTKQLFIQKQDAFKSLSNLYADQVPEWNMLDRGLRTVDSDKEVQCVYRQNQKKGMYFSSFCGWQYIQILSSSITGSCVPNARRRA